MTRRVLREPAPEHTLLLQEHLVYAPEAAKGKAAEHNGNDIVPDKQGQAGEKQPGKQPCPPALFPPAIFHSDDQGMTDSDAQEDGGADNNTVKIHIRPEIAFMTAAG